MIKMKKSSLKHRKCQEAERGSEQLTLKECRKATFIHNESTHRKKTKKHRSDKARRNTRLQLLQSANISIVNSFFIANQLRSRQQQRQFGYKSRGQRGTMFPLAKDTKIVNKCGKKQYTSAIIMSLPFGPYLAWASDTCSSERPTFSSLLQYLRTSCTVNVCAVFILSTKQIETMKKCS